MSELRAGVVTMKGNPLTLVGPEIKVGDKAPDFNCLETIVDSVNLQSFEGKNKIFNVIISVDTPVCDVQTKRFNQESSSLGNDVEIITVSVDLPFALSRYCAAEGIDNLKSISDYADHSFGKAYGLLIEENKLLARAIIVVDKENIVRHVEYVSDITNDPNYDAALEVVKSL